MLPFQSWTNKHSDISKDDLLVKLRASVIGTVFGKDLKPIEIAIPDSWFHALRRICARGDRRARKKQRRLQHQKRKQ